MDRIVRAIPFTIVTVAALALGVSALNYLTNHEQYVWTPWTFSLLVALPLCYLVLVIIAARRGRSARLNIVLATISVIVGLYVSDLMLALAGPYITLPKDYDRRSKLEVVLDMRRQGEHAVPSVHPKDLMNVSFEVGGKKAMPLAGIPHARTVFCNETGKYYIYDSDEYGFTNPSGLYMPGNDIALVGDSFTQGFCAPFGQSYAERIRAEVPRTVNVGNNGDGPLVELAVIREILAPIKPRYVFWFYFEGNDAEDLSRELAHPVLSRYLENPNFTQGITENASEFDKALRDYIENRIAEQTSKSPIQQTVAALPGKFKLWSRLWHMRALMGLTDRKREWPLYRWNMEITEQQVESAFHTIMPQAKSLVEEWGGTFVVVYLPSYKTFEYAIDHPWRARFIRELQRNDIPMIDMRETFYGHADPISLFNYRKDGHYTPEGNAIVARAVLDYLSTRHFVPQQPKLPTESVVSDAGLLQSGQHS